MKFSPAVLRKQQEDRHEAIRALLLGFIVSYTQGRSENFLTLEDGGHMDLVLSSCIFLPNLEIDVGMTPEAYFSLLIEYDLLEAHRAMHSQKAA